MNWICKQCNKQVTSMMGDICMHCHGKNQGTPTCIECGLHVEPQYKDRNLCFSCQFWTEKVTLPRFRTQGLRINGDHYMDGGWSTESPSWRGYGGRMFAIKKFAQGEEPEHIIVTNNLWHQGTIPAHFRDRLPDNAIFMPAQRVKQCPCCGKHYYPILFSRDPNLLIQEEFPNATAIEREQLVTGICSDNCWNRYLGAPSH